MTWCTPDSKCIKLDHEEEVQLCIPTSAGSAPEMSKFTHLIMSNLICPTFSVWKLSHESVVTLPLR